MVTPGAGQHPRRRSPSVDALTLAGIDADPAVMEILGLLDAAEGRMLLRAQVVHDSHHIESREDASALSTRLKAISAAEEACKHRDLLAAIVSQERELRELRKMLGGGSAGVIRHENAPEFLPEASPGAD